MKRYIPPPYGQHFLHDKNILALIVRTAGLEPDDAVLEIGAGTGRLTEMVLAEGVQVAAVEVDAGLHPHLEEKFSGNPSFRLVKGDVLRLPWGELLPREGKAVVLGNLPYAISTQIIFKVLENRGKIKRSVFLVQWEVAVRMAADPGGKDFGILSVACQLFGKPEIVRKIPPTVFLPPPRVDSALIRWDVLGKALYPVPERDFTMRVVKAAFGQRRKKLVNGLAAGFPGVGKVRLEQILLEMGLSAAVRAEQLTVGQFADLACRLNEFEIPNSKFQDEGSHV
jgi:16S rRNA (adenine1518-N6/adenine1519-N6)-dimethyltransferase